ncbi:Protein LURP-one-related 7 [Morella rubra]|uniref:Protein LURP-one-related 7 n=1 Tax=Morella rubra TaxID=262757 RepID=A0A6A1WKA4_9ROSI|nr:Protein LURP-one-related 7 [Morella rubra]
MANSAPKYPVNSLIPVDLFVSKKHPGLTHGYLGFADASGNIVYKINREVFKSSAKCKVVLLDSAGNSLVTVHRQDDGSWQGYRGDDHKDVIFKVKRTAKTELEVILVDSATELKVKGCAFQKSCTIYKDNEIVAQTSLMYKLHQLYVKKGKFRLTIFPGSIDHALVAALIVVFLDGKR